MDSLLILLSNLNLPVDVERIIDIIIYVTVICTAITAVTPSKTDNLYLNKVLDVLNVLAGNILRNRNADAVDWINKQRSK